MDSRLIEAFQNLDDRNEQVMHAEAEVIAAKQCVADARNELARALESSVGIGNSVKHGNHSYLAIEVGGRIVLREF